MTKAEYWQHRLEREQKRLNNYLLIMSDSKAIPGLRLNANNEIPRIQANIIRFDQNARV